MTRSVWYQPVEPDDFATYDGPHAADPGSLLPRATACCVCGWHPDNHRGYWLADHLRDMNATPSGAS